MKRVKIKIEFTVKSDPEDDDLLKADVIEEIQELIEQDELEFSINDEEEDEDEDD